VSTSAPAPLPSATVVPIRDADAGLEVLLLERAGRSAERPVRPWVFPGGRIEDVDAPDPHAPVLERARRAAVREAREEAGLELSSHALLEIARWITPEVTPRRFDTWFFLATLEARTPVRVDGGEIAAHRWLAPRSALRAHEDGEIRLAPPTFVTVTWLAAHRDARAAAAALTATRPLTFRPRIHPTDTGACILYPGDAGYEDGRLDHGGPLHRLWAEGHRYRYERRGV